MLIAARIGTALFGIIALLSGAKAAFGGLDVASVGAQLDNDHRYMSAIWFTVGLGLLYSVPYLTESTALFRFLMLSIFVGGVARAIGWMNYPPDRRMIVAVVLELVFPVLLVFLQSRVAVS